jgi:hypothetical protein
MGKLSGACFVVVLAIGCGAQTEPGEVAKQQSAVGVKPAGCGCWTYEGFDLVSSTCGSGPVCSATNMCVYDCPGDIENPWRHTETAACQMSSCSCPQPVGGCTLTSAGDCTSTHLTCGSGICTYVNHDTGDPAWDGCHIIN